MPSEKHIFATTGSVSKGGHVKKVETISVFKSNAAANVATVPSGIPADTTHLYINKGSTTHVESADSLKSVTTFE